MDDLEKLISKARKKGGESALRHLKEILNNNCFRHTGICPDDRETVKRSTRKTDMERIEHSTPVRDQIVNDETEDLCFEEVEGEMLFNIYTDGSMLDGRSDHFARAGWGMYLGNDNKYNKCGPLHTASPTTFRAELRAIVHAFMHCASPFILRSDCKAAVDMVNAVIDGGEIDHNHEEADLLEAIKAIHQTSPQTRQVIWMPAHLDEEANQSKKEKYLRNGGNEAHIVGNCGADHLAKQGADMHSCDKQLLIHSQLRQKVTVTVQNFMVDIWRKEKEWRDT